MWSRHAVYFFGKHHNTLIFYLLLFRSSNNTLSSTLQSEIMSVRSIWSTETWILERGLKWIETKRCTCMNFSQMGPTIPCDPRQEATLDWRHKWGNFNLGTYIYNHICVQWMQKGNICGWRLINYIRSNSPFALLISCQVSIVFHPCMCPVLYL